MATNPRITGTFLDEITHDIPSQNWGREEWAREFRLFDQIGIDTIVLIRGGYRDKCVFAAETIPGLLPVYHDLAETFFDLADQHGIGVFFGTYDSGVHWWRQSWWREVDLNVSFVNEVAHRYGHHPSFKGWYLSHETSSNSNHIIELFNNIGQACKEAKNLPVLISPFPQGAKQPEAGQMGLDESMEHWERIFAATHGSIDICAFQDGQIHYAELPAYLDRIVDLGGRHGLTIWSNIESFDRDMPIKFPPADWRYLRYKIEAAASRVDKLITFEFPHFMSPNSIYPAAHNLFKRYEDYVGGFEREPRAMGSAV